MKYRIIIRPEAETDLSGAFHWYEEQNAGLGLEFFRCVEAAFDTIIRNPELYRKVYKDIRRALTSRFPYGVFYLIDENKVIIIAVFHAKRNPELLKEREHEYSQT